MKPFSEEDLIAYHLHELPRVRTWLLRRELERDAELAAESESIAATLRVFRDSPVPQVDEAMLERTWSQVRPSLAVLPERPRCRWVMGMTLAASSVVALVVVAMLLPLGKSVPPGEAANAQQGVLTHAASLIQRLRGQHHARQVNDHSGPLTTEPVDAVAGDPAMAAYLDSAERLLTEVSHEKGAPDPEMRNQVHQMLLENAVYQRSAHDQGDLAAADVMDDLGRVLVSLDAEPPHNERSADDFRIRMSVGSVLFDLRVLHHNPGSTAAE